MLLLTFTIVIFLALLAHGLAVDASPRRLCRLAVNGSVVTPSAIVVARRSACLRTGLLNHGRLHAFDGLWLSGVRRIHTRGMLFPIDVVFLGGSHEVLTWTTAAAGTRRVTGPRGTKHVLELAAGSADGVFGLRRGDHLGLLPATTPRLVAHARRDGACRRILSVLSGLVVSLALSCPARSETPKDPMSALLALPGLQARQGEGRINGVAQPMAVIAGPADGQELFAVIKKGLAGRFTVTRADGPYAHVIVIADVQSPACPACRPLTKDNVDLVLREAFTVSTLTLDAGQGVSPLMFASATGALVGHKPEGAIPGLLRRDLAQRVSWDATLDLNFAGQNVRQMTGIAKGEPQAFLAGCEALRKEEGFTAVPTGDNAPSEGPAPRIMRSRWIKPGAAASCEAETIDPTSTRISIHVSQSQPRKH